MVRTTCGPTVTEEQGTSASGPGHHWKTPSEQEPDTPTPSLTTLRVPPGFDGDDTGTATTDTTTESSPDRRREGTLEGR